jgi:hypothetical protein
MNLTESNKQKVIIEFATIESISSTSVASRISLDNIHIREIQVLMAVRMMSAFFSPEGGDSFS